ncbi:MAG: hypothetical protein H0T47_03755 [Planctomycetaceae bacterium]|nr:hypothetical protein [Planctomycetaceae bacterium]
MQSDPAEEQDLARERSDVVKELAAAFDAKWREVSQAGFEDVPVPVGLAEWPGVTLPGNEAVLHPAQGEGISYHGKSGWANDWIDNWTDETSFATWPIEIITAGEYEVSLDYCCPPANMGSVVRVEAGAAAATGEITQAHDPPPLPSPDRFRRPEVYEKTWKPLSLGNIRLERGRTNLTLRADRIVGGKMPQIIAVEIKPADGS